MPSNLAYVSPAGKSLLAEMLEIRELAAGK